MKQLLSDILKVSDPEKGGGNKYSLSRVCLLISFLLIMIFIFIPFTYTESVPNYQSSIDVFFNLVVLFSTYSFGNKALQRYQDTKAMLSKNTQDSE